MANIPNLKVTREGEVAILSIARPDVLNALNDESIGELETAIAELDADRSIRGIVVTGGEIPVREGKPRKHSFVSGADIAELAKQGVEDGRARSLRGQRTMNRIEACGKPVIAAINGFCFGGGFELALACHWRYASKDAVIGLPECTLGIVPGYGGTQRLSRLIGPGRALEMICTAARLDAAQAHSWGVVNAVVESSELLPRACAAVTSAAKCAPMAVRYAIDAVLRGADVSLAEGLRIEADLFGMISASHDMKEGMQAFLDKRPSRFFDR